MPAVAFLDAVGPRPAAPRGVVVLLPGGRSVSRDSGSRRRLTHLRMLPFAWALARRGFAGYLLRYRYRGWNGPARDAARDAAWALDEVGRRHPGLPVVVVGHSMGGRAALAVAGAPNVVAVCALAPWLDGTDAVDQLAGRAVLIVHGDRDRYTDPRQSYAYAVRAKRVTDRTARVELPGAGHYMLRRARVWHALVRRFAVGALGIEPFDPLIANALRQPAPDGLRVVVAPRWSGADR